MSNPIIIKVLVNNKTARGIAAQAIRESKGLVLDYTSRRAQIDMGVPRALATPFYTVAILTRYAGRAIKMKCDKLATELVVGFSQISGTYNCTAKRCGVSVLGIPAKSPDRAAFYA